MLTDVHTYFLGTPLVPLKDTRAAARCLRAGGPLFAVPGRGRGATQPALAKSSDIRSQRDYIIIIPRVLAYIGAYHDVVVSRFYDVLFLSHLPGYVVPGTRLRHAIP